MQTERQISCGADNEKDLVDFIINLPLFEFLEKDELAQVATRMHFQELAPGETLFNEWDRADFVCFIESGELDVTKKTGPDSFDDTRTRTGGTSR